MLKSNNKRYFNFYRTRQNVWGNNTQHKFRKLLLHSLKFSGEQLYRRPQIDTSNKNISVKIPIHKIPNSIKLPKKVNMLPIFEILGSKEA